MIGKPLRCVQESHSDIGVFRGKVFVGDAEHFLTCVGTMTMTFRVHVGTNNLKIIFHGFELMLIQDISIYTFTSVAHF